MDSFSDVFKSVFYVIMIIAILVSLKTSSLQLHKTVYDINYINALEDSLLNYLISSSCLTHKNERGEYERYIIDEANLVFNSESAPVSTVKTTDTEDHKGILPESCIPLSGKNPEDEFDYTLEILYYNEQKGKYEKYTFSTKQGLIPKKHALVLIKSSTLNQNLEEQDLYIPALLKFGISKKEMKNEQR